MFQVIEQRSYFNTFKDVVKPRTFAAADSQSISSDFGNFVRINNLYGGVQLYDTIELSNRKISSGGSATGSAIGQARVFSFSFDTGDRIPQIQSIKLI